MAKIGLSTTRSWTEPELMALPEDGFKRELVDGEIQLSPAASPHGHVTIQLTPGARRWLAERGYDKTFGARPMARLIQTEIKRVLADEMLFGQLRDGGRVEVDAGEAGLTFRYAPLKAPAPVGPG